MEDTRMEAKSNVDIISCGERLSRNRGSYTLYASPRPKHNTPSQVQDLGGHNNGKDIVDASDIDDETGEFFEVFVMKEKFKFSCAHFVAFQGFRERLHGHNYQVGVRMRGRHYGYDGYVIDFGDIKKVATNVCKELNEHFICPMESDVLKISIQDTSGNKKGLVKEANFSSNQGKSQTDQQEILIECEDGVRFIFPLSDVACLPIKHSTAEELAVYIWNRIVSIPVATVASDNNNNNDDADNDKDNINDPKGENVNLQSQNTSSSSLSSSSPHPHLSSSSYSNIGQQKGICIDDLVKRGIYRVEVNVAEAVNQEAKYSRCLYGACDGAEDSLL